MNYSQMLFKHFITVCFSLEMNCFFHKAWYFSRLLMDIFAVKAKFSKSKSTNLTFFFQNIRKLEILYCLWMLEIIKAAKFMVCKECFWLF